MTSGNPSSGGLSSTLGGAPPDPVASDIRAARAGCEEALNRLFQACRPYLLMVANDVLPTSLQAKLGGSDVVQETLLQIGNNFARFHGSSEADLIAWLRGALINNVHEAKRRFLATQKRGAHREISLDAGLVGGERQELVDKLNRSPGRQLVIAEENVRLEAAMARLSDDYRRVIQLRNWEDHSFAEVGHAMQRSADAARKLWGRALEQLRLELLSDS